MWRKDRLLPYSTLTLVVGTLLSVAVCVLTALIFRYLWLQSSSRVLVTVILLLTVVTSVLVVMTLAQLMYAARSTSRDARQEREMVRWQAELTRALREGTPPPPLDAVGQDVLLMLREERHGTPDGERLAAWYEQAGKRLEDEGLARAARHPNTRAFALERLALLRSPDSLPLLLELASEARPSLRNLAVIGAAQVLATGAGDVRSLLPVLTGGQFTMQQCREVLNLLGEQAEPLLLELSRHGQAAYRKLAADTAAYMAPLRFAAIGRDLLQDVSPEVQASALTVFAEGGRVQGADLESITELADSPYWFVRSQAASALARVEPIPAELYWTLLGDSHWWVRRNAGRALAGQPGGAEVLRRVLRDHPDLFARDMARAMLEVRG